MTDENLEQNNIADNNEEPNLGENNSELATVKIKAEEYLNGWKRAKADYINLKKDTEKRTAEIIQYANAALIAELLPIFDNFKLALKHIPEPAKSAEWVTGFIHIKKQFDDFLKQLGIEEIKTDGDKFNPEFHEAVATESQADVESGVIYEEVKSGYTLHGKVVVPAKVKVAK
ncbi:MAG: nucleotide exchange factor GrpE [Patescibacteria group bacterium]|nr:nucleotide exchange factor GrpE [Patescibacteria group bacterium]